MFVDFLKNNILYRSRYKSHDEAVIITCYFNPTKNPYRLKAFNHFYDSIKHLNHRVIECVIGDSKPELPETKNIKRVFTESMLWHKESLLNTIIKDLPLRFKYIFWVDADVLFTNKNWLVESVEQLKMVNILQPFEYCIHLEQDQLEPDFDVNGATSLLGASASRFGRHPNVWRSFCANAQTASHLACCDNYDLHGHVGFAWGARREVLTACPLYDRALIGGADHIMAHAAAGHIPHSCIVKSFTDDIDAVNEWSKKFYAATHGFVGYAKGNLYHIWHGDLKDRQYLKRIQEFTGTTKTITQQDVNGLYKTDDDTYVRKYFDKREYRAPLVDPKTGEINLKYPNEFLDSMVAGYLTNDPLLGAAMGGDIIGGMIGAELRPDDTPNETNIDIITTEVSASDSTSAYSNDNFS